MEDIFFFKIHDNISILLNSFGFFHWKIGMTTPLLPSGRNSDRQEY